MVDSASTSHAPFDQRVSVLVLEDEPAFQLMVRMEIEGEGVNADIEVADRLADGLALLRARRFDIILTDLNLPDSSGIATFERLTEAAPDVPVIVFSSLLDEPLAARILRRGAQDYIHKGKIVAGALARTIRRAIERHSYARELDRRARQLAESEARVRAIYEASIDAVVVTDVDGIVRFANPAAGIMFGRPAAELVGQLFGFPVSAGATTEIDVARADGSVGVAEMHVVHLPWNGQPAHLASLRDITDRKVVETQIRESEERFRLLVEGVHDYAFLMLDDKGAINAWNAGAQRLTGFSSADIVGRMFSRALAPDDGAPGAAAGCLDRAAAHSTCRFEHWCRRKDGSRFWSDLTFTAILGGGDRIRGFAMVIHDLTERRESELQRQRMELRLRVSQKLEAIGQLAAGIAHEINTPAHYVGHNLEFAQASFARLAALVSGPSRDGDSDRAVARLLADIPPALDDAAAGVQRIATIVRAMKEFSHPGDPGDGVAPGDLNHAIENTLVVAQHEWRLVADVVKQLDAGLPPVPLRLAEFNQVVLNLLVNAAHAIGAAARAGGRPRGTITIATVKAGDWAEVRIRDTGDGIPEDVRHRIFEPFFTTKDVGEGTGQGLAHAHNIIVKGHGGEIGFETETGVGTCFTIRLPLNPAVQTPNHH